DAMNAAAPSRLALSRHPSSRHQVKASGFLLFWLLWPLATTWASFPWIAAGLRRIARDPGPSGTALLALGLALQVLGGHPESTLHGMMAACLYALLELALAGGESRLRIARRAGAAALVAAAATAIFWLPLLDALPQSAQFEQRSAQTGTADAVPFGHARGRLLVNLLPFRFGIPWAEAVPVAGFFVPTASAYVGSSLLGLGLFGLWRHPWRGRFALAAFAAFAAAAGASLPPVVRALEALPLLSVAVHRRWTILGAWAIAGLVALGAEAWQRSSRPLGAGLCQLAVAAAAAALLIENWPEMRAGGLSDAFLRVQAAWLLAPAALAAGLLAWPALGRRPSGAGTRGGWLLALLALALAQRVGESAGRFRAFSQELFYPKPAVLELIPRTPEPSRFVATGESVVPNTGIFWGLEDVRGYQPLRSALLTETYPHWPSRHDFFLNRIDALDSPMLDFLGVTHAVVGPEVTLPAHWRSLGQRGGWRAAENTRAARRAFVPRRISPPAEDLSGLGAIDDFAGLSWIEPASGPPVGPGERVNGPGTVASVERRGARLAVEVSMERAGWMVVSESAWRGWRATDASGRSLPVGRANHAFLAIPLPAGESRIDLRYLPRSFVIGRTLSLITLGALLALGLWRLARAGEK
ncbi:MAG: YfhO family protein, partial [Acidobacteriota bacterium]